MRRSCSGQTSLANFATGTAASWVHPRLKNALSQARTLLLKEKNVRRDFLMLKALAGFYRKPAVDK